MSQITEMKRLIALFEYITRQGDPIADVLWLNLFADFDGSDSDINQFDEFANSPEWAAVDAKYRPISNQLRQEILARAGYRLNHWEAQAIDNVWYDGSDSYSEVELGVEYLPQFYESQMVVVRDLLDGVIDDEYDPGL